MKVVTSRKSYFFSLSPIDKEVKKLFYQFRNDDIYLMYPIIMGFMFAEWINIIIQYVDGVQEHKLISIINLVVRSI